MLKTVFRDRHGDPARAEVLSPKAAAAFLDEALGLLMDLRRDAWQTARTNQMNLTGVDLLVPGDGPHEACVGHTRVHQPGIDESLELVERTQRFFQRYAMAHAECKEKVG